METETARNMVNRRGRAGARNSALAAEVEHESGPNEVEQPRATFSKPKTRNVRPVEQRTHFSFSIDLPVEWQGALKRHSIDEQEEGTFIAGSRESDVNALLRHVVKDYCEGVVRASEERRARRQ